MSRLKFIPAFIHAHRSVLVVLLLCGLGTSLRAAAQTASSQPASSQSASSQPASMQAEAPQSGSIVASAASSANPAATMPALAQENLQIGAGDLLAMTIFDIPEMTSQFRVSERGDADVPLLGQVHVSGLMPKQASTLLEQAYLNRGLLTAPHITIIIQDYATQGISILGEVTHPGTFVATSPLSLLHMLSRAGGLTPLADSHVIIKRYQAPRESVTVRVTNNAAQTGAEDIKVYPGDTIIVPKAGVVYVVGDVMRPGGYPMQDYGSMSVLQALSVAQGANPTASLNHAVLVRRSDKGVEQVPLSLKPMLEGKVADMALRHDDILYVPISGSKAFFNRSLPSIVGAASSATMYSATAAAF